MKGPQTPIWNIEKHTSAKHAILQNYLKAWYPILVRAGNSALSYVEGFSGPGHYSGGELGSPLIALEVARNIDLGSQNCTFKFFFVEEDSTRFDLMVQATSNDKWPAHFEIQRKRGSFADVITAILDKRESQRSHTPYFAFIDPFGYSDIPFDVVLRLLKPQRAEVLITFMSSSINRFITDPTKHDAVARLYGTSQLPHFDRYHSKEFADMYVERLRSAVKDITGDTAYVTPFRMVDNNGTELYYLIHVTRSDKGFDVMKKSMWDVDPTGSFTFSDAQDPSFTSLLSDDHPAILLAQLHAQFAGQQQLVAEKVREFVRRKTKYLPTHLTQAINRAKASGELVIDPVKVGGRPYSSGFPDDARVTFIPTTS